MEEKFKAYRAYDYTLSSKWQLYLSNVFPIPSPALVEKLRRKWYRDNIDKTFDISYDPVAHEEQK